MPENDSKQGHTPMFDPTKPIDMEILFKAQIDDLDEYLEAREKILRGDKKDVRIKTREFLPEIEGDLSNAVDALVKSAVKYGSSKKNSVLSMRIAFDLLDRKHKMVLTEHLPYEIIYNIAIFGKAMSAISNPFSGGLPVGMKMPTGEEIRQLDSKALEDMPQEVRQGLLEVITELKKKLEEGNAGF